MSAIRLLERERECGVLGAALDGALAGSDLAAAARQAKAEIDGMPAAGEVLELLLR